MKKKVAERLRPYLALAESESELTKTVKSLPPAQLGELKDLMGRYVQEMEHKINSDLSGIKNPDIRELVISPLTKVKKINSVILEVFNLRQQNKIKQKS